MAYAIVIVGSLAFIALLTWRVLNVVTARMRLTLACPVGV